MAETRALSKLLPPQAAGIMTLKHLSTINYVPGCEDTGKIHDAHPLGAQS